MKRKRLAVKGVSVLMAVLMLLTNFSFIKVQGDEVDENPVASVAVTANGKASNVKKKVIYMVMDNSDSMYFDRNGDGDKNKYPQQKWCQVKYAMQVFASMMDFENGDQLRIYPMHDITIGKNGTKVDKFLSIESAEDLDEISQIYSSGDTRGTPFETVKTASSDLNQIENNQQTEKWLLILTDGAFTKTINNGKNLKTMKDSESEPMVKALANNGVNVEYFQIRGDAKGDALDENTYHKIQRKPDSEGITEGLVTACNQIFQRDVFTADQIKDDKISFDVSMKKILIFAQGSGIKINSFGGHEPVSTESIKYSELSGVYGEQVKAPTDNSLEGTVATFTDFKANEYKIDAENVNISDLKKCIVCYEADVDINVILKNSKGQIQKLPSEAVPEGEYTVGIGLYDNKTNKKIDSKLLGRFVLDKDNSHIIINGQSTPVQNGTKLKINGAGFDGKMEISGTYGNKIKYHVTTKGKNEWVFKVEQRLDLDIDRQQKNYTIGNLKNGKGIIAKVKINGKELDDEQLKNVNIKVSSDKKIGYKTEIIPGKSAYRIKFDYYKGKKSDTDRGYHDLKITATVKNAKSKVTDRSEISVTLLPIWVYILFKIIILAIIVALVSWYMTRKVGPKNMRLAAKSGNYSYSSYLSSDYSTTGGRVNFNRKTGRLDIESPSDSDDPDSMVWASMSLVPLKPRYMGAKKRKMAVTDISLSPNVQSAKVGGVKIEQSTDPEDLPGTFLIRNKKMGEYLSKNKGAIEIYDGAPVNFDGYSEAKSGTIRYTTKVEFKKK